MATFEQALPTLLDIEGGFSDHPADRGGPTNLGVTMKELSAYLGRAVSVDDILALTPETVAPLYLKRYWAPLRLDEIHSQKIAVMIFNQAVLNGVNVVCRNAQTVLGNCAIDGVMGANTIVALNATDEARFCFAFAEKMALRYARICESSPSQSVFIEGWVRRLFECLKIALSL